MIKVIAFDLIGVLAEERQIELSSDEEKIERLFGKNKSDNEFLECAKDIIGNDKPIIDITKCIISKLYKIRQNNIFEKLKESYPNIKLIIDTNHISFVKKFIKDSFNTELIDDVIVSADIGKVKPDLDFYQYILDKFNIESSELLFLDDNKENVNSAKEIGINTIKVETSMNLLEEINKYIISNKMQIYNLQSKLEYLDEVAKLEYEEWASNKEENKQIRIERKKEKICNMFSNRSFCKLILINNNKLIGFISLFPSDCDEEKELTPWYATMYVKKEYRNHGYSKILNDAILSEARNREFKRVYLKTNLKNYYEKFGAIFIKKLKTDESLYKFEL